jgi:sugar diacid utilization regulator
MPRAATSRTTVRKPVVRRPRKRLTDAAVTADSIQASRPTLGRILDNLGSSVAEVIVAPRGLDIPVAEPLIYDAMETSVIGENSMVLAVGTLPDSAEARQIVAQAGNARAAACLFKLRGHPCPVVDAAEGAGVALVAVDDEISWMHLSELMTRAVRTLAHQSAAPGLAGVPLGDLFALANAIAAMVGGAVSIEDPRGRVYAYSTLEDQPIDEVRRNVILGRQIVDTPGNKELYQRVFKTEGVVHSLDLDDLPYQPRLAIAVRAGGDILGSIWVMWNRKRPTAEIQEAMAEAARITALHIIHARGSLDIERRVRGDVVRSLLEGRGSVASAATRLGLDPEGRYAVLAFELNVTDQAQEDLHRERLVDFVALYCEAYRRRAACAAVGRIVYALLPVMGERFDERLMATARQIHDQAESRLRTQLRVAVGSAITTLHELPRARREVDRILRVLAADRKGRTVASLEDVGSQAILIAIRELAAEQPEMVHGRLEEIIDYDAEHGTSYMETLRTYFDGFGDIAKVAGLAGVHPNTLRYRLRRLGTLFKLDLNDPDERLVAELQLRLLGPAGTGIRIGEAEEHHVDQIRTNP